MTRSWNVTAPPAWTPQRSNVHGPWPLIISRISTFRSAVAPLLWRSETIEDRAEAPSWSIPRSMLPLRPAKEVMIAAITTSPAMMAHTRDRTNSIILSAPGTLSLVPRT